MEYNLFLDDSLSPKDIWGTTKNPDYAVYNWVTVKDHESFITHIEENGIPFRVSFDHNLCDEHETHVGRRKIPYDAYTERTGYDCALWLIEYCIDNQILLPKWKVHAAAGSGRNNIESVLNKFEQYQRDNPHRVNLTLTKNTKKK